GDRDHRAAAQRAALCQPAQHHEGEEEADRREDARGLWRRRCAADRDSQDHRAARPKGRREGEVGRRARRQAQERDGVDLMATLLLAEHDNKTLKDATNKALTAAKQLGGDVHVLVAGQGCRPVAEAAAKLAGVAKVLLAEGQPYEHMLAEPVAALVVALAPGYDALVAPATTAGKNIMPRVAALLDVMQVSDIVKVIAPDTFERLIYAGNAVQTVRAKDKTKVITVRTSTFQATGEGGSAPIEAATPAADPGISSFVGEELSKSERPELTS